MIRTRFLAWVATLVAYACLAPAELAAEPPVPAAADAPVEAAETTRPPSFDETLSDAVARATSTSDPGLELTAGLTVAF